MEKPLNLEEFGLPIFALRRIASTAALERAVVGLRDFLIENADARERVEQSRESVIRNLKNWDRQGWLLPGDRPASRRTPEAGEIRSVLQLSKPRRKSAPAATATSRSRRAAETVSLLPEERR
jgi:hypothetical protein